MLYLIIILYELKEGDCLVIFSIPNCRDIHFYGYFFLLLGLQRGRLSPQQTSLIVIVEILPSDLRSHTKIKKGVSTLSAKPYLGRHVPVSHPSHGGPEWRPVSMRHRQVLYAGHITQKWKNTSYSTCTTATQEHNGLYK